MFFKGSSGVVVRQEREAGIIIMVFGRRTLFRKARSTAWEALKSQADNYSAVCTLFSAAVVKCVWRPSQLGVASALPLSDGSLLESQAILGHEYSALDSLHMPSDRMNTKPKQGGHACYLRLLTELNFVESTICVE